MKDEISQEAKEALANAQLIRARNRLRRDGCSSADAFRRRVLVLAAERNFPPAEYAKLMHKGSSMKPILEFCRKHDVSLDWLMDGDLKGLQRMKQWAKQDQGMTADQQRAEILRLWLALPPEKQKIAFDCIKLMVAVEQGQ
jgi:hypothetical protein